MLEMLVRLSANTDQVMSGWKRKYCEVLINIHTYPGYWEGNQKFQGGGGLKATFLKGKYEAELEFPGKGGINPETKSVGGV